MANRHLLVLSGLMAVVLAAVVFVHWPALSAQTISFDDCQYLVENRLVQNPGWSSTKRFLTEVLEPSTVDGYYQPLTMISLMIDYAIGGRTDNLGVFHRTSLCFHAVNTLLVVVFLYMLFGEVWPAAMAGLVFGVHPLTVDPIPWVGERKTLLAAFFALWCLIFYVRYVRGNNRKFLIGCVLTYILSLMSKPTSVPLPVLMVLMDFWPLKRLNRRAFLEKVPLFVIMSVSVVITIISQAGTSGVEIATSNLVRIPLTICHNIVFYLYKIIFPVNLSSHYPIPKSFSVSNPMISAGLIGTCILLPLLLISLRKTPAFLTGWLIFFVMIFPTMGVIGFTSVIAADKFAYLPSIGLLIILAWFLKYLWDNVCGSSVCRTLVVIFILLAAVSESAATRRYLRHWRDTECYYKHMLALSPTSEVLHGSYGGILLKNGRLNEAVVHFNEALRSNPRYYNAANDMGVALMRLGRLDEAIEVFKGVLNMGGIRWSEVYANLGLAYAQKGHLDLAVQNCRQALLFDPDFVPAHINLGMTLAMRSEYAEAIAHYRRALEINPDKPEIYNNLGAAILNMTGDLSQAAEQFRQAVRLKQDYNNARLNLATVLTRQGKFDEAIMEYRQVLQFDPKDHRAVEGLESVMAERGKSSGH